MRLCIVTQDVYLDEVVEALEKSHLLKEFCPLVLGLKLCLGLLLLVLLLLWDLRRLWFSYLLYCARCKVLYDFLCSLKLLDYGLESELSDSIRWVLRIGNGCQDDHRVIWNWVKYLECIHVQLVFLLRDLYADGVQPFPLWVDLEKFKEQICHLKPRVVLADFCNHNGIRDSS